MPAWLKAATLRWLCWVRFIAVDLPLIKSQTRNRVRKDACVVDVPACLESSVLFFGYLRFREWRRVFQLETINELTEVYHVAVLQRMALFSYRLEVNPGPRDRTGIGYQELAVFGVHDAGVPRRQRRIVQHILCLDR